MNSFGEVHTGDDGSISLDADNGSRKTSAGPSAMSRVRRRNRMITSCLECRRRKLKCDRLHPCTNCSKGSRDCVFLAPSLDSATRLKLAELKERMGTLERSLENEATHSQGNGLQTTEGESIGDSMIYGLESPVPEEEEEDSLRSLKPTRLALMDAVYDDEADDVMVDLGIQLGKMRVTDRLGGFVRPRLADEVAVTIQVDLQGGSGNGASNPNNDSEVMRLLELANRGVQLPFLEPGPTFIAPLSDLLLGSISRDYTLLDLLPTREAADTLLQQYWEACHPVARILHRQTFEARHQILWDDVIEGIEPPPSVQAICFATFFTAAVSMTAERVTHLFGVDQRTLIERFQLGVESALRKAHFLRSTKTETLQAFVMYLIPMCRDTISRAHSALVGSAIRLAECMGLHRDPLDYNCGPVETHIRRLIWYQLCFLDIRTAEVQGPRVTIRREDYSTKFPVNMNDIDIASGQKEESTGWTDMTFARVRFECQELIRDIMIDRILVEQKKLTLTAALAKVEVARKSLYERYGLIFKKPNLTPLQRTGAVTMSFILHRFYIILLHRFYNSWSETMPDRMVQLIINTGAQQLEDAVALETAPEFETWRWYSRAYHNYHTAFLLLMDVSMHPLRREADRIWKSLDYIYDFKDEQQLQKLTRRQIIELRRKKAHWILCQFRDRMRVYRTLRKIKYSADVNDVVIPGADSSFSSNPKPTSPAVPQSEASLATFNLTPQTFLPSNEVQAHARVRQAQFPYAANFESLTSVPTVYTINESGSSLPANVHESMPQFNLKNENSVGNTLDFNELQSIWSPSPPGIFAGTVPLGNLPVGVSPPSSEDIPMPEVDWTEWDKMFPPHLNDGNLDLSPNALSGSLQLDTDPNAIYMFPYPPFQNQSVNQTGF